MKLETLPPMSPTLPDAKKNRWKKPVIALLVLAVAGGGWTVLQGRKAAAPTAQAATPKKDGPPKVEAYELVASDVATVALRELHVNLPLSGSLVPLRQATVKSKVSGEVKETMVQEGMNVAAGQPIARLDQADLRARVAQQQAALDDANARLALATKNASNNQALLKQNYISQSAYDTTQNSVDLARAAVKQAQAQLEVAQIALNDTVIRAPMAGTVSKRFVQAGDKLSPDMPAFSVVDLREMTLEAQVPASEIPRVKVGQEVQFQVDGFQGRRFSGKVARINPTTEAGSRAMTVYISVDNADGALRGGMFAKGAITTEKSAPMPLVPLSALRKAGDKDAVQVIQDGKVQLQPVSLGLRNEDEGLVEVRAGLAAGAQIITAKLDIKAGDKVKVQDKKG
ncbi:efflux RND transporter periplasmic adaptor subunit [Massilia sp. TS11]|uniref:efflux RND transporter periplasmic adaptor subunit n=1 Tax=Massilia sp. TS11 TaxID=2908003 RepID=UPI001EDC74AA|nr:efflux RND transporter periplasmic adaptor subunit [Massilia sp. TS11]MCG2583543.1 efflux RND transporter periplasmic adaptor subunit [Massilia sp. TS11]